MTFHTRPQGPKDNWPLQRGFDRFYGTIIGAGSFYDPATLCRGNTFITPPSTIRPHQPETYYYTHAINDNAVAYLQEHAEKTPDKPFFLYVAHTAAHWPMHALPKDIAKYKGRYDDGFAPIREARLKRLKEMGIVGRDLKMSPRSDDWDKTPHKDWERRNMEVYAAMVDSMDQGIGRIIEQVKKQGQFDNTLFSIFKTTVDVQKGMDVMRPRNPTPNTSLWGQISSRPRYGHPCRRVMVEPLPWPWGHGRSRRTLSLGTAEDGPMSLTLSFREYKHFAHEGGIATPLVHWPKGISKERRGKLEHHPGHLIDIMATCVDLANVNYPKKSGGHDITPLEGVSLAPAFSGQELARKDALYFEHHLNCAIRDGDWKLVRYGQTGRPSKLRDWELLQYCS